MDKRRILPECRVSILRSWHEVNPFGRLRAPETTLTYFCERSDVWDRS